MHIRDGILEPEVCIAAAALSFSAITYSLRRLRLDFEDRAVPLTGMMAALIFAGQMVNFPLFGLPVSGHLLGGVLASVVLGPWAGCLAVSMVLIVQSVMFSDGGLLSLGANIFNMAVIGAWGGYAVYSTCRNLLGRTRSATVASAVIAAWLSVLAAAGVFCFELSFSTRRMDLDLRAVFGLMVLYHALIGIGEAIISGTVIGFILSRRAELIPGETSTGLAKNVTRFAMSGIVLALAIAAVLAPFKSESPDGLDAVSQQAGFAKLEAETQPLFLSDYEIPFPVQGWWSVSSAGLMGTVVVLLTTMALVGVRKRPSVELTSQPDGSDG